MHYGTSNHDRRVLIVQHAVALPASGDARKLLERVRCNAEALLKRRGWRVLELVELCCCKAAPELSRDGDTEGWCIADSSLQNKTAEKIAIRLRETKRKGHSLLDFETVFGCMIHELAHIVHDKHTKGFYKLMDELQSEWEQLEAAGQIFDEAGFPTIGGHRIDSAYSAVNTAGPVHGLARPPSSGRTLANGTPSPAFGSQLDPRERSARAAERRASDATRCGSSVASGSGEATNVESSSSGTPGPQSTKRRFCGCYFGAKRSCSCDAKQDQRAVIDTGDGEVEEALLLSSILEKSAGLIADEEEAALQAALAISARESKIPPSSQPRTEKGWHNLKVSSTVIDLEEEC
eukprot:TRINITY_DN107587_c0_g1_i1.p1 TRINITY_DN107587_c0_g1~~TRINITY_DN107587_c0_g1_i1.p1  ORF type:complete len:358 (+),score=57.89 TRINITY_DN107587_c0_g1_i1:29-1075(+)